MSDDLTICSQRSHFVAPRSSIISLKGAGLVGSATFFSGRCTSWKSGRGWALNLGTCEIWWGSPFRHSYKIKNNKTFSCSIKKFNNTSSFLISSSFFSFITLRSCSRSSNEKGHISTWLLTGSLGWKGRKWGTACALMGAGGFSWKCKGICGRVTKYQFRDLLNKA